MDYCSGGDLRYQLPRKVFNEQETKFMMACLVSALEHVHSKQIVHRDIKPENLVFDNKGFLKLTDFGVAQKVRDGQGISDTSGTPGYMAPEVICKLKHSYTADFYAVGICAYELMFRRRPYGGADKN